MTATDCLPALAERIAADTGRDPADVAREIDELDRTPPDVVDPARVVALLAPTVAALGHPELSDLLAHAEQAPAEARGPLLGQLARTLAPAVVQAVTAQEAHRVCP